MSEEDAFLRAIHASPADATARLVYADWLDERNDPRAEYLRLAAQPPTPETRRRVNELRPQLPAAWLATLGDYHARATFTSGGKPDPRRIEEVAALVGRPSRYVDADKYQCTIDAAAVHPLTGAYAYLECRGSEYTLRVRDRAGGATSWVPYTYNPYFGCDVRFLEWFGDAVVMIYREKHGTYIARAGIDQTPDYKGLADQWVLDGRHVAYWKYQEPTVRRLSLPDFEELPPLTPDEAAAWGVLPEKFW